jgi:integrase/recombinase XerC
MKENTETQKLMDLCDKLPEVNQTYILNLNKSSATKVIYAYELIRFNDHLREKKEKTIIDYQTYSEISYDDIQDYFRIIINKGNEYNTIQRARTALNGWFNTLNDIHAVSGNPVCSGKALERLYWETTGKDPRYKEKKAAVPDMADFLNVVANGTGLSTFQKKHHEKHRLRDVAIVALILDTGIKVSELTALNAEDYDRKFSQIYVRKRELKINTDTKEKLDQYIDQGRTVTAESDSRQSPLFVTSDGKRLAVRSIQNILKKYSAAGNSPQGISAERLREISAERYYQETGDVQGLKERLGVKSMTAVEKYISPKENR